MRPAAIVRAPANPEFESSGLCGAPETRMRPRCG